MFSIPAYAQTTGAAAPTGIATIINLFGLPLLILGIFWFIVFRPQQAAAKAHRAKIDAVKKGDTVLTAGGIIGKAIKIDGDTVEVEIAANVRVKVAKATLSDVTPLGSAKPAND